MGINFSLIGLKDRALHKSFEASGLESRMIDISNGSTIHCWVPKDYTPPRSEGLTEGNRLASEKPVLVMLHGFGASATWQWEGQIKTFLSHFTLVIPDLVFFGRSTTSSSERTESFQAECVWQVLVSLGITEFSVVGTSYGGFVAYRLTQAHGDAVTKVVLSNSSICMIPEDDQALCKRGGAATVPDLLLPTTPAGLHAVTSLVFNKPAAPWYIPTFVLKDYINVLYNVNRAEKVEMLQKLVFGKENAPDLLTKIDQDILIVWGENDNVFLPEQAVRMKSYFGDQAELVMLKDAGHVSQLEQTEKWNSLVLNFLIGAKVV